MEFVESESQASENQAPHKFTGLWRFYVLICIVGVLTCALSVLNDVIIKFGQELRGLVQGLVERTVHEFDGSVAMLEACALLTWVIFEVTAVCLAHVCARRRPLSYGSGIPEIRCELQGTHIKDFFSSGMLQAKVSGLVFAEVSGLPVGKEGPMVHCASVITQLLLKTWIFAPVAEIPGCLKLLLTVSIAVGTVSTFGVPIGGVLFALEMVPDDSWDVMTYWACIVAAVAGSVALRVLPMMVNGPIVNLLPPIGPDADPYNHTLKRAFLLVMLSVFPGIACGLLGALFVQLQSITQETFRVWTTGQTVVRAPRITATRKHTFFDEDSMRDLRESLTTKHNLVAAKRVSIRPSRARYVSKPMRLCILVALLDALGSFAVPLFRGASQASLLWDLVASKDVVFGSTTAFGNTVVPSLPHDTLFEGQKPWKMYTACLLWRFLMTAFTLSLPIPAGAIVPSYVVGALIGRLYAELLSAVEGTFVCMPDIRDFHLELAIIGATAFTASVCRSFSVAIAVFELVGQTHIMLPTAIASIISIHVGNRFSPSFFDLSANKKRLPSWNQPRKLLEDWGPISDVMRTDVPCVWESYVDGESARQSLSTALAAYSPETGFAVLSGTPADGRNGVLVGWACRRLVANQAQAEFPVFDRSQLLVAPQVHTTMPVKHARAVFKFHQADDMYVTGGGKLLGIVNWQDFINWQADDDRRFGSIGSIASMRT